jgi:hypothetical protein
LMVAYVIVNLSAVGCLIAYLWEKYNTCEWGLSDLLFWYFVDLHYVWFSCSCQCKIISGERLDCWMFFH